MRHADAWRSITRALSAKATPSRLTDSGGTGFGGGDGSDLDSGGGTASNGRNVSPSPAAQRNSRLPPRPSTPLRPDARAGVAAAAPPASSSFVSGGYAPFQGTDAATAAAQFTPRTPRTVDKTYDVDDALAVRWMKASLDPAAVVGDVAAAGAHGAHSGGDGRHGETPIPRRHQTGGTYQVIGKSTRLPTPRGDGGYASTAGAGEEKRGEGPGLLFAEDSIKLCKGIRAREEWKARVVDDEPAQPSGGRRRYPATPLRPPRSRVADRSTIESECRQPVDSDEPPTYAQSMATPTAQTGVLPPKHRFPSPATNDRRRGGYHGRPRHDSDSGSGGGGGGSKSQQQQQKGGIETGLSRRFWFRSASNSRRASFDEAVAEFNNGGGSGTGGSGTGGAARGAGIAVERRRATTSGRVFPFSPGRARGPGGVTAAAEGAEEWTGGEEPSEISPSTSTSRWGNWKGGRPPSTPKPTPTRPA